MRTVSIALLLLLALTALDLAPAAAADNGEWSVRPADSAITPRAAFQLPASPGATVSDRAVVTNTTDGALTFRLYVADAHNTERDGGLAVRGVEETQRDVGAWGKPERDVITVPARSSLTVGITLRIPSDASPGDHVGALVAVDERVRPGRAPTWASSAVSERGSTCASTDSADQASPSRTSGSRRGTHGYRGPPPASRPSRTPCTTRAT
ncbi:hypothetical protein GCM10020254_03680 [Streptomyces goshikiensis]